MKKHYADWRPITAMITSVLGKEEHIKRHKNVRTHAHTVLRMYYLAACINSCWTAERALQVVCNTADHSGDNSRMQSISRYISAKYAYIKTKLCLVSLRMATHTCALIQKQAHTQTHSMCCHDLSPEEPSGARPKPLLTSSCSY